MNKFRRKKISRYTTFDNGVPALESTPKPTYPSFTPEIGSFNRLPGLFFSFLCVEFTNKFYICR